MIIGLKERTKDYQKNMQTENKYLKDPNISLRAKAIIAMYNGRCVKVIDVMYDNTDGKAAINAALNELVDNGYASVSKFKNDKYSYRIYDYVKRRGGQE